MTDHELDKLLKSAETPERSGQYWREFPKNVSAKLHWQRQGLEADSRPHSTKRFIGWASGLAFAYIAIGWFVHFEKTRLKPAPNAADHDLAAARKCYQELESLFPHQLESIVFDDQGPHMVLAPKADVPAEPPLYLKICGPKGCEQMVTFSGQQVKFNGENCEVLANADGQVMLVGSENVWTGNDPAHAVRIESRIL